MEMGESFPLSREYVRSVWCTSRSHPDKLPRYGNYVVDPLCSPGVSFAY